MTHIMLLIGEHARQRSRQSELDLARTPGVWLTVDNNADVATPYGRRRPVRRRSALPRPPSFKPPGS
jgi:predicted nucleic acid-binding Zn ribbon protein